MHAHRAMAKESELILVRTLAFDPSVFPGYRHSTTDPQVKAATKLQFPCFHDRVDVSLHSIFSKSLRMRSRTKFCERGKNWRESGYLAASCNVSRAGRVEDLLHAFPLKPASFDPSLYLAA